MSDQRKSARMVQQWGLSKRSTKKPKEWFDEPQQPTAERPYLFHRYAEEGSDNWSAPDLCGVHPAAGAG